MHFIVVFPYMSRSFKLSLFCKILKRKFFYAFYQKYLITVRIIKPLFMYFSLVFFHFILLRPTFARH